MRSYFSRFKKTEYLALKERYFVLDFFSRLKFIDSLDTSKFLFNTYIIEEGERPDTVALKLYGNPDLDWIVLMVAKFIDIKDWSMTQKQLLEFVKFKYLNPDEEAFKVRDGRRSTIESADTYLNKNPFKTFNSAPNEDEIDLLDPTTYSSLTFRSFEESRNDNSRIIKVLKSEYLDDFISEVKAKLG